MSQAGQCEGKYINQFTHNGIEFNELMKKGYSVEEAIKYQRGDSVIHLNTIAGYNLIYQYEVDGIIYYRATKEVYHRKDKINLMNEYKGYSYKVTYNMDNPSISYIGERIGEITTADKDAKACLILAIIAMIVSFTGIPGIVLGIISLVKGSRAIKNKTNRDYATIISMIVAGVSIPTSIIISVSLFGSLILSALLIIANIGGNL